MKISSHSTPLFCHGHPHVKGDYRVFQVLNPDPLRFLLEKTAVDVLCIQHLEKSIQFFSISIFCHMAI